MKRRIAGISVLFALAFSLGIFVVAAIPQEAEAQSVVVCRDPEVVDYYDGCWVISYICEDHELGISWEDIRAYCYY